MIELQKKYISTFTEKLDELISALEDNSIERLRAMGHKLHGSGASYGFKDISVIGKQINQAARELDFDTIRIEIDKLSIFISEQKNKLEI